MVARVAAVARSTFLESVRDRVFYLLALFGLVLIGSSTVLSPLTIGAQAKIVLDVGLAALLLFGLLVAVLVGSNMVRKEIDRRTITTILAKPVGRREYLLGKYCGLSLTLTVMVAGMLLLLLVGIAVTPAEFSPRLLAAAYLTLLELLLINAAVLLFSTFVSPALSASFTLALFGIGHLSQDLLEFGRVVGGEGQARLARLAYHLVPDLEIFNVRGAVVHGDPVAATHVLLASVYALCWVGLLVLAAGSIFSRRELR